MSLYHEGAEILATWSSHSGGSLKSRIFRRQGKVPPAQLYALVLESSKWSSVLKEVIERADLLKLERKLTPELSLLLVHDLLLAKGGISLAQSHGLRACVERHKGRLGSELTLARLRRRAATMEALREQMERDAAGEEAQYPRWVRVNALKSSVEEQLETTFATYARAASIQEVSSNRKNVYLDAHVPNLLAVSPGTDLSKTAAYAAGKIVLQDKASCFPAYLLDPGVEDGDVIDACAAPGNKTTHLAAILHEREETQKATGGEPQTIYAFERDARRAQTLEKMVRVAGAKERTKIGFGQDFLQVNPHSERFKRVGALLLDPSCSGSGIVGRDSLPVLHLPAAHVSGNGGGSNSNSNSNDNRNKRKRKHDEADRREDEDNKILRDDDGNETAVVRSEEELETRLEALAAFQLTLLEHAFEFSAARKITYSTCSTHSQENEEVVVRALRSDVARRQGWRMLRRGEQVEGMREWPVRGLVEATQGDEEMAEGCIRSYKGDGRGVMGFFVAGFVRDGDGDGDGTYLRDKEPMLRETEGPVMVDDEEEEEDEDEDEDEDGEEEEEEDEDGEEDEDEDEDEEEEWGGVSDDSGEHGN